jgi:hypothetical protein
VLRLKLDGFTNYCNPHGVIQRRRSSPSQTATTSAKEAMLRAEEGDESIDELADEAAKAAQSDAAASSVIRATGGTVAAEVHLANPSSLGTHYDVRLIQLPRASN